MFDKVREMEYMICTDRQIPKIIHLFWFGKGEKGELIESCIASWKKYAPDYQIMEWNENNFDVNFCERSKQAYAASKWAFVADVARLKVIYEMGGIYLDTDIQLTAPLNDLIKEANEALSFFMFHNERFIGTGYGFGAVPKSDVIGYLLRNYEKMNFELKSGIFAQVCTHIETEALVEFYPTFVRNNMTQFFSDGTVILSTNVWQRYLVHLGTGTWVDGGREQIENAEEKIQKYMRLKMWLRNPQIFTTINKVFGKKAEYVYEFLVYDLIDMGPRYYIRRAIRKMTKEN